MRAVQRAPLEFLTGDAFREQLHAYLQPMLRKGVPSLFVSLLSLYGVGGSVKEPNAPGVVEVGALPLPLPLPCGWLL